MADGKMSGSAPAHGLPLIVPCSAAPCNCAGLRMEVMMGNEYDADTIVECSVEVAGDGWTVRVRRADGRWLVYQQPVRHFRSAQDLGGRVMLDGAASLSSDQWFYDTTR